jgi:hypothetical protein
MIFYDFQYLLGDFIQNRDLHKFKDYFGCFHGFRAIVSKLSPFCQNSIDFIFFQILGPNWSKRSNLVILLNVVCFQYFLNTVYRKPGVFGLPRRFLEGSSKFLEGSSKLFCRNVRNVTKSYKTIKFQQKQSKCHRKPWFSLIFNQNVGLVEFGLKCPSNGVFVKKYLKTDVKL